MAQLLINVGDTANDRKGDSLRIAFQKINTNFSELYTSGTISINIDGGGASTIFNNSDTTIDGGSASSVFENNN